MTDDIILIKRDHTGKEVWRYTGRTLRTTKTGMLVEARFNRSDLPFHGMIFKQNDRFVELYLIGHWLNIYEIHDRDDDVIKGWYCNVTRPPLITPGQIAYDDLALDLLVYPDGRQLVLDENEFAELNLSLEDRKYACRGLERIKEILKDPAHFSFDELLGRD